MNNKPETSADIEAELRELSVSAKSAIAKHGEYQPTVYGKPIALYFAELADRIKAALKQELCNGAAMRDALVQISGIAEAHFAGGAPNPYTISDIANAALSAPPRNCDRFSSVKEAAMAFAAEVRDKPHPCPDFTFSAWLYAPATEQKGETDGSK